MLFLFGNSHVCPFNFLQVFVFAVKDRQRELQDVASFRHIEGRWGDESWPQVWGDSRLGKSPASGGGGGDGDNSNNDYFITENVTILHS